MKREPILRALNFFVNVLLISSVLVTLFGLAWEYSTRWYLSGFSNAVLPYSASPENKISAILTWMAQGPARETEYYSDESENRDPLETLNFKELLSICGTGTNAFVNLASAGGLEVRRVLLLDSQGLNVNHVVAEVLVDGRWVIVDPSFHRIMRDVSGHLLTRQELARPDIFAEATRDIPGYDPAYNYEHTAFLHFGRLPVLGQFLQTRMNSALPAYQEIINWSGIVERQSNATFFAGLILLCFSLCLRRSVCWYGRKFSIFFMGPWEQLSRAGVALFTATSSVGTGKSVHAS